MGLRFSGFGFESMVCGFRVCKDSQGCRVQGAGCRVQGAEDARFRVHDSGCRV
jgi:hypothetical protein